MNENLAYLAGLFDGEGSFSIQVAVKKTQAGNDYINFNARMTMTIKYGNGVLKGYMDTFGGNIYKYPDGQDRWSIGKISELKKIVGMLLPYLRIKKCIAIKFLEALNTYPVKRINRRGGQKMWTPEMVEKVATIALTLNPKSSRRSKQSLAIMEELKKVYS